MCQLDHLIFFAQNVILFSGYCPEPEEMDNAVKSVLPQYAVGTGVTYVRFLACNGCSAWRVLGVAKTVIRVP